MKLGWADFKYLSTHPVVSLRARDQGKRINSTDALWHKLGYEVYQQRRVDPLDTDQHPNQKTDDSDASLIRPETALEHKLDYDVYRDDAAEATTHRHSVRTIYNHGLGRTRGEMAHRCSEWRGEHALCESILFSSDPAVLALLEESEQVNFARDCTASFVETTYQECFGIEEVDFSFVLHDKPDRDGRDRLHAHITAAGTYYDEQTRGRRSMPFVSRDHITHMQAIADRVVEQQLDLYIGREWRLYFPEYEKTYQTPSAALADVPLDVQLGMLLEAPLDGFGDAADIARLVEKLFGEPTPEKPVTPTIAVSESPVPNELDIYFPRPAAPVTVPEQPRPELQIVEGDRFQYEGYQWYASPNGTFGIRLERNYDERINAGWLTLNALWRDPQTKALSTTSEHIFDSHFTDSLPFNDDALDIAEAQRQMSDKIEYAYTQYLTMLQDHQFDRAFQECYQSWFQNTRVATTDPEAVFLAELPRSLLPPNAQRLVQNLTRLPQLEWIAHPETLARYAFTIGELDDGSAVVDVLKQWIDGDAVYQVQRMPFYSVPNDPFVQAGGLNNLVLYTHANFADGMHIVQAAWDKSFAQSGESFLEEGPPNPFATLSYQEDLDDSHTLDEYDEPDIDDD